MSGTIILYDIPSVTLGVPWSPNTGKIRCSLNYKGIPYKTVWVECADIETICKSIGAPPTGMKSDGCPRYTVPMIYDPSTRTAVSDSTAIALYLDTAYPHTPTLFPPGALEFQNKVLGPHYNESTLPVLRFFLPAIHALLNPPSAAVFRKSKEAEIGVTLEELTPKGKAREEEWAKVREWYKVLGNKLLSGEGPYVMGQEMSFLDFVVVAQVQSIKMVLGEESVEWEDVKRWDEGWWVMLCKSVEKYDTVL